MMFMTRQLSVYLASDSTCQSYGEGQFPQAGWGQFIGNYFNGNLNVFNHAIGGRSSKTFVTEGRLDIILSEMQEGDYLLIQMGHNDSTVSKPERYTKPHTTYKVYLKMYVDGARERKGIPVLITPVARLHQQDGRFVNDFPDYCNAMKELALAENVPLIDLMDRSLECYASVGYEYASSFFMVSVNGTDCTHFTEKGAKQIAELVAQGVKDLNLGISEYVK
jgi:lysophospholipase L1-like esterase